MCSSRSQYPYLKALVWGVLLLLAFSSTARSNSDIATPANSRPLNVLMLYSFGYGKPIHRIFESGFRPILETRTRAQINYFTEILEWSRFADEDYEEKLVELFQHRYSKIKIDLIITFLKPALDLTLKYREDLFPGVPVVYTLIGEDVERVELGSQSTGIYAEVDIEGTVNTILQIHPDTDKIAVISGASTVAQAWEAKARKVHSGLSKDIEFIFLSKLPLNDLLKKVSELPERTVVLFLLYFLDGSGRFSIATDVVQDISRASSAPVYGLNDIFLGRGIVGGKLNSAEVLGSTVGDLGARILLGEDVQNIPEITKAPNVNMFDWRELKRWKIDQHVLPAGSDVRFRELSFWETYKWLIIGILAVSIIEAILIFIMLLHRKQRKRAEHELSESEKKLRNLIDNAPVGISITSLDGIATEANPTIIKMFGYESKDEFLKVPMSTLYSDPEDRKQFLEVVSRGTVKDFETRFKRTDGTVFWGKITSVSQFTETGTVQMVNVLEDVTDRRQNEEKIRANLEEKEILLKEIHHRVKNNLQSISGLLNLQATYGDDVWVSKILKDCQNRILSMALIHERLYQLEDLSRIDFSDYVYQLARQLKNSFGSVAENVFVRTECEDTFFNLDTAIPCGLIITELVSNALKHGFPNSNGEVWVRLKTSEKGEYELSVSDNGIGLPSEMDFESATTLGLMLVRSFVEFLAGTIELDRDEGTAYRITFREYEECPMEML
jgi:PAS domain S-box-containing protein